MSCSFPGTYHNCNQTTGYGVAPRWTPGGRSPPEDKERAGDVCPGEVCLSLGPGPGLMGVTSRACRRSKEALGAEGVVSTGAGETCQVHRRRSAPGPRQAPLRARPSTQPTLPLCSGPLVRSQPGQLTTHGGTGQRERPPALSATARTQRKQRTSAPAPGRLPACSGNLNAPALQKETVTALKSSGTTDKCYTLPGRSHHPRH